MVDKTPRHPADLLTLLAMVYPTVGAWVYFVLLHDSEWARNLYLGSKLVQFALPLVWVAIVGVGRPRLGLSRPRASGLWAGITSGILISLGIIALYQLILAGTPAAGQAAERIADTLKVFGVGTPLSYAFLALALALVHSLLEEYYWRWFVYQRTAAWLPTVPAVLLASVSFASHHLIVLNRYAPDDSFWTLVVPGTAAVGVGGILWCWLYDRYGSLLSPWVSHIVVDLALMVIGYLLVWGW